MDADFRAFASALLSRLPGLPFFVFGGESWQTRDLFLATLANVSAAATSDGTISVRFFLSEAHRHLHDQFEALIAHGVTEDEAITEMSRLAAMLGMTSRDWL